MHGDITDAASLDGKLAGCDAVINLVGIIRSFVAEESPLRSCTTRNGKSCQGCMVTEGKAVRADERIRGTT